MRQLKSKKIVCDSCDHCLNGKTYYKIEVTRMIGNNEDETYDMKICSGCISNLSFEITRDGLTAKVKEES